MVQLRMIQDLHCRADCARFRVVRAVHQALDAGMHQRPGAHGARFNCNKEFTASQAMVAESGTGFAQRDHFGVRCGVAFTDVAIPSAANDTPVDNDYRADGNFSGFESALRAAESFFHPEFIGMKFVGRRRWSLRSAQGRLKTVVGRWQGAGCFS
jgi:hypothetical protein